MSVSAPWRRVPCERVEEARMRVVLANDAVEVRSALRLLLEQEFGAEIVGEVGRDDDLLVALASSRPDLLVLDWDLSMDRLLRDVPRLRVACSGARIIALSTRPEERMAALTAGVDGFASKGDGPEHLVQAVRSVFKKTQDGEGEDEG
ncbi:MAG: response regulator [Thermoleophilia bacterium]